MEGDLSLLSIPDLLQMICLGGYSRDIHLFEGQTQLGVIAIRNGRVDRCFGYGAWGEAAFFKLVNLRRGRYKVNDAQDMSASDATLTAYSWQELLMEAARQQDEAARAVQVAGAMSGRVIPFPTPHAGGGSGAASSSDGSGASGASLFSSAELNFDFSPDTLPSAPPLRAKSDTGRQSSIGLASLPTAPAAPLSAEPAPLAAPLPTTPPPLSAAPPPTTPPPIAASSPAPASTDSTADDVMNLLQEATACYLRRDLARAEALLQKCLELRPGDKRALQNLDRIRRKKPQ
jgi:Domain of unknown function (DUF4388)